MTDAPIDFAPPTGRARRMLARAFFCQNVAVGSAFGGFTVSVLPLQERFHATRAGASLGLTLAVLTMGLIGPLAAAMIARLGLRLTMAAGVVLSGAGYVALAFAPNLLVAQAAFGLLIGPAVTLFGPFASSMLASNWFPARRGQAVGVANVPLFVALVPLAGAVVIQHHGLAVFYLGLAGLHLLLLPLVLGVQDRPPGGADQHRLREDAAAFSARTALAHPMFWLTALGGGVLSAVAIVGVSHVVALAMEKGAPAAQAAGLASVMGGASVVGSLCVGALCDRVGGARALAMAGLGLAASWAVLLSTARFGPLASAMLLAGACGAGIFPCVAVLMAQVFGVANLARTLSLYGLAVLPLTFILPQAASLLRDLAGGYEPVILAIVAGSGGIAAIFFVLGGRRPPIAPVEERSAA